MTASLHDTAGSLQRLWAGLPVYMLNSTENNAVCAVVATTRRLWDRSRFTAKTKAHPPSGKGMWQPCAAGSAVRRPPQSATSCRLQPVPRVLACVQQVCLWAACIVGHTSASARAAQVHVHSAEKRFFLVATDAHRSHTKTTLSHPRPNRLMGSWWPRWPQGCHHSSVVIFTKQVPMSCSLCPRLQQSRTWCTDPLATPEYEMRSPSSGWWSYSHRLVSGSDMRMDSMRPPVFSPNVVPRSYTRLNSTSVGSHTQAQRQFWSLLRRLAGMWL